MIRFALCAALALVGTTAVAADAELTPKQLAAIWERLGQNGAALDDIQSLAKSPGTAVPFLKERLQPVGHPDTKRIEKCLADLDSRTFRQRENAARELEAYGQLAGPAIEAKLREKLPLEVRRRLEALLAIMNDGKFSAQELRAIRAIDVLRLIGNAEAVAVLEGLARGAEGAVQTAQARQALADLGRK